MDENNIDIKKIFNQPPEIVSDDRKVKPEALKFITNKQFLELRKIAPESFDKIMFSKGQESTVQSRTSNLKRHESKTSISK
ncbi:MAG: hypothetical protein RCG15_03045 [Candidatus Rickettsia vulgarisii]